MAADRTALGRRIVRPALTTSTGGAWRPVSARGSTACRSRRAADQMRRTRSTALGSKRQPWEGRRRACTARAGWKPSSSSTTPPSSTSHRSGRPTRARPSRSSSSTQVTSRARASRSGSRQPPVSSTRPLPGRRRGSTRAPRGARRAAGRRRPSSRRPPRATTTTTSGSRSRCQYRRPTPRRSHLAIRLARVAVGGRSSTARSAPARTSRPGK